MVPEKYEEVKGLMESRVYSVEYLPNLFEPSIAFVSTPQNSTLGNVSMIFVNDTDEELAKFLFMHECGHVLYGHQQEVAENTEKYFVPKIVAVFPRVRRFFNGSLRECITIFVNFIFNIVKDLEVNSRMFSNEELDFMDERTRILLGDPECAAERPEYYGLPRGKTWNEYITLILLNPEKFLALFRLNNYLLAMKASGKGLFNGTLTEKEFDQLKQMAMCNRLSKTEEEKMKKKSGEKVEYGVPNGLMDGYDDIECENNTAIRFSQYTSMPELLDELRKLIRTKKRNYVLRDQMYNANRKKHSSNVIIPKDLRKNPRYNQRGNLFLLFDVSGSVDPHMVHDFLSTIKNVKDEFRNTQVVFWDTDYVAECTLEDEPPDLYGGGNNIAAGIKYMENKYQMKKNDAFFVISDFYDDISAWNRELKPLSCHKYAIDWSPNEHYSRTEFEHIIKNATEKK